MVDRCAPHPRYTYLYDSARVYAQRYFFLNLTRFSDYASGDRVSRVFRRGRRTVVGGPPTVCERQGVGVRGPHAHLDGFRQMGGTTSHRPAEQRTESPHFLSGRLQDTETVSGIKT